MPGFTGAMTDVIHSFASGLIPRHHRVTLSEMAPSFRAPSRSRLPAAARIGFGIREEEAWDGRGKMDGEQGEEVLR